MMRFFGIFYWLVTSCVFAQSDTWWVYFADKNCNTSISLSKSAIDKRLKKKIPIDFYDYAICQSYIDTVSHYDVIIRRHSRWLNAVSIKTNSSEVLDLLLSHKFIKKIKPVLKLKPETKYFSNELLDVSPSLRLSSSLLYGASFNQIDMLGGVGLHNEGYLGNGISIAVFDAGFIGVESLPIFDNLWLNNQIIDTYDFVDNDSDVFVGSVHGTMVLSTMGGYMADSLIGTAPEANYMLFRTEDSASETLIEEDYWAAAAEYADSVGVDIINSSLGYTILYDDTLNSHSYMDMDGNSTIITKAADLAASRGILVVNSAGNSGNSDWYYIGAPADGDSVLAVGAVNAMGQIASFSSRGPTYDGRIKPNICAQGVLSTVADQDSTIRYANGTSFSAPIIAGLSACLWQALLTEKPDVTNMDVFQVIQESAHLFESPNDSLGYGIPNFYLGFLNALELTHLIDTLQVYPNPYTDYFVIDYYIKEDSYIKIYNSLGQIILSKFIKKDFNRVIVDELSQIPQGVYFLTINNLQLHPIIKK
tara:strand:- start:616 stop:2217 length:1602 start_codon:yes stop_codon:yes gene_type:complete